MSLHLVPTGKNAPEEVNVIIEIPMGGDPIKYEVDKDSGALFVDRVLGTAMHYPCNYGYIPHTLCGDGDPADVLVYMNRQLVPGSVISCRPVGVLKMSDESGEDAKIIAVPSDSVTKFYQDVKSIEDLSSIKVKRIAHFFEHYKDLEEGKWVKIEGWGNAEEARAEIKQSIENFNALAEKPRF
ncbi:inorganic diphosphatase [Teredinibacter waterburyi]|jgi:Inorganic pyrophosphatase|uniref:inorganic diphosphatase n=1 Tax=Teredinibacter waterburyi TaxID=1500538 RepID=UPI00165F6900|nr:inorganic diphosphatase [Teredinibacter waterburyi]